MLQTTSDQVIYKTRAVGPSTFIKAPLLPTARQLRKRWNQHIQLLGNGIAFLNQPSRSHRAINHAVVVGQLASIQQIKLPPFKVNKLLELDVIAQSPPYVIHLPTFVGACRVGQKVDLTKVKFTGI